MVPVDTTSSTLSDFTGPVVVETKPVDSSLAIIKRMVSEAYAWFDREFDLFDGATVPSYSPSGGSANMAIFINESVLKRPRTLELMYRYAYYKYSDIEVRITFYAPKNMTGAFVTAVLPYQTRFATVPQDLLFTNSELMLRQDSHFVDVGESYDVVIKFPWSYKFAVLPMSWLKQNKAATSVRLPGEPILAVNKLFLSYVSSLTSYGVSCKAYVKYNGMEFFGPGDVTATPVAQSGWEKVAKDFVTNAGARAFAAGIEKGSDAVVGSLKQTACENFGIFCEDNDPTASFQDEPEAEPGFGGETIAMLPSLVGNISSVARSRIRPIFGPRPGPVVGAPVSGKGDHFFSEYLARPQPIGYFTATGTTPTNVILTNNIWKNHSAPSMVNIDGGSVPATTWIRYFKPLARYWRGLVFMHFVVCGHSMVEVELQTRVTYPSATNLAADPTSVERFTQYDTHRTVFSGSKTVTVPLPFLTHLDYCTYLPNDTVDFDGNQVASFPTDQYTTLCNAVLTIRATMLDATPVIPCFVFFSCGPDFKLFQPLPPGVPLDTIHIQPTPGKDKQKKTTITVLTSSDKTDPNRPVCQVHIPSLQGGEMHSVRCMPTPDPGTLKPLVSFEGLMSIWSRPDLADTNGSQPFLSMSFPQPSYVSDLMRSWYTASSNLVWFSDTDYIGYLSSMFLFWKGDIAYKAFLPLDTQVDPSAYEDYVCFFQGPQNGYPFEKVPTTTVSHLVTQTLNPGFGVMVGVPGTNPVIEFSFPYKGITGLGDTCYGTMVNMFGAPFQYPQPCLIYADLPSEVQYQENTAVLRKIGQNFQLYVEGLPPPLPFYLYRGKSFTIM